MRLCLVIPTLGGGGAERVACLLAGLWAERGVEVVVVTLDNAPSRYELPEGVERRALGLFAPSSGPFQAAKNNWRRIRALRKLFGELQPDAAIGFMPLANVTSLLAVLPNGPPIVATLHTDHRRSGNAWWRALESLLYPLARFVVAPTAAQTRALRGRGWRVRHIPHPVVIPPAGVAGLEERADADVHARTRETKRAPYVVAMGRLIPDKRFDLALDAFALLPERHSNVGLLLLGEGPSRPELEAQARRLGLEKRVEFAGFVEKPWSLLRGAECLAFSSEREGFSLAILEALAHGVPVVATDCDYGPPELVRDGVNGFLVPAGQAGELATALDRLLSSPELRERMSRNALESVKRFSPDIVLERWDELLGPPGA